LGEWGNFLQSLGYKITKNVSNGLQYFVVNISMG